MDKIIDVQGTPSGPIPDTTVMIICAQICCGYHPDLSDIQRSAYGDKLFDIVSRMQNADMANVDTHVDNIPRSYLRQHVIECHSRDLSDFRRHAARYAQAVVHGGGGYVGDEPFEKWERDILCMLALKEGALQTYNQLIHSFSLALDREE